ncbi:hypothetical protein CVD28_01110 [Bacillus sp. M6-12]|uniref:hypothetical protein n=1 Tax=Bacillus sp. M6-12 TaxID=2054166 RepID=UPI000C76B265|nr:hypothetical protein [Bacillus sp. M6-12]PLS19033.1 hypothetical protein CVD28_01110 [Bacillus sp. M6-12]
MQFIQAHLKTGKTIVGYVTNTYGSQIQMLSFKDETLTFTSFSKSALDKMEELRPLTEKEISLLEYYISYSKEISETEYKIRKLQSHKDEISLQRDKKVEELLEQALISERKDNAILSVSDIENLLTETGYKNLFLLQRYGLLLLGEFEEVIYIDERKELVPLMLKQAKFVASLLNDTNLTKEVAFAFLNRFGQEAIHERLSSGQKQEEKSEKKVEKEKKALNFADIKDKLNEHGYQALKKLQETRLLTIHEDGTMDFGEIGKVPMLQDMLNHPKLLVDVLNQPLPALPINMIPFPIGKNLGGILKEIEKQFRNDSPDKK